MKTHSRFFSCLALLCLVTTAWSAEPAPSIRTKYLGASAPVPRPDSVGILLLRKKPPKERKFEKVGIVAFTKQYYKELDRFLSRFKKDAVVRDSVFRYQRGKRYVAIQTPFSLSAADSEAINWLDYAYSIPDSAGNDSTMWTEAAYQKDRDYYVVLLRFLSESDDAKAAARRIGGDALIGDDFEATMPGRIYIGPGQSLPAKDQRINYEGTVIVWTP